MGSREVHATALMEIAEAGCMHVELDGVTGQPVFFASGPGVLRRARRRWGNP